MEEKNSVWVRLNTYLMTATIFLYGSLVLFLRLGGNFSTSPLWPFIRVGCKWTLFAWMVYGGMVIGKRLSSPTILGLKNVIKNLEYELLNAKQEHSTFKADIFELQAKHVKELNNQQLVEAGLRAKLQKFERTPAEANRLALRDFL